MSPVDMRRAPARNGENAGCAGADGDNTMQLALNRRTLGPATLARLAGAPLAGVGRAWSQLWFQESPTTPLEIARIGIGAALLCHYAMVTPYLLVIWGDAGWMPRDAALQYLSNLWMQSVFFYFTAPWQWYAFHALFLLCCAAFMLGWRTAWVKWIVLAGQISYNYRNMAVPYGVDIVLACLLYILCFAPIGRVMSLDRVRAVRAAKRGNLAATLPPYRSRWAGACIRLMQIQMAVMLLYSGLSKRGDDWWNGDALWDVISGSHFYNPALLDLLAHHYWLVNAATYATILIEVAYPFLIWQKRSRPYMLAAVVLLHLQFFVLMRLFYFSFVMIMGHMSFVRPEWLQRLGAWWKRKAGDMEMIYDGRCGFCVHAMAWLLAFDGLGQIRIRDFRADPSAFVSDAQLEKALYTVLPDGRALPGFEGYRYVVLRVPGLWWLVPVFYLPVLSRLLGRPIYHWFARRPERESPPMAERASPAATRIGANAR
jgi:predicted DCC family thiol-disulfide oxidoreductase YuxK